MATSSRATTFDEKRAQVLYDDGATCRAIADALGCAPSTVSRWAKKKGLKFDRTQTDMATRAHTVELAAARIELAQLMFVAARDGLLELDGPITVYSFGGKENEFNSHTFDRAPVDIRRQVMTTAGIAFDKVNKIVEASDDAEGLAPVESMLGRLAVRFGLVEGADGDA
ncbi:hypothetical protein J2Y69_002275 [Microbacterium resistens]|uniref:Helix-turn-helix domain-containing protein n=1 Tax=Microbacterium resistens TaxID=156977 RepID=A0ABU1SDJ6_9MICO|nr:helix-turn-helix domain-containing protein [Microbacterium resistens]MDR6867671.1 hypothetical protein [Microbacterium resistens]